jgi:hypothetical protein
MGEPAVIPEGEVIINVGCDVEAGISLNWDKKSSTLDEVLKRML